MIFVAAVLDAFSLMMALMPVLDQSTLEILHGQTLNLLRNAQDRTVHGLRVAQDLIHRLFLAESPVTALLNILLAVVFEVRFFDFLKDIWVNLSVVARCYYSLQFDIIRLWIISFLRDSLLRQNELL